MLVERKVAVERNHREVTARPKGIRATRDLCLAGPREEILESPKLEEAYGAGLRIVSVEGKPVLSWADNGLGGGEVKR